VFRYRLHSTEGHDLGESTYAVPITPGEEIFAGNGIRFHVLDVVACEDESEPFVVLSPFVGLLHVEATQPVPIQCPNVSETATNPSRLR
jgi:hypothetical protein